MRPKKKVLLSAFSDRNVLYEVYTKKESINDYNDQIISVYKVFGGNKELVSNYQTFNKFSESPFYKYVWFDSSFQASEKDSAENYLQNEVCDNKIFDRCEIEADFKFGARPVEDTILNYLKEVDVPIANGKATFNLIVAKTGEVFNVNKLSGSVGADNEIKDALKRTSGLWTIGKQNSFDICDYVVLEIEILNGRIKVTKLR